MTKDKTILEETAEIAETPGAELAEVETPAEIKATKAAKTKDTSKGKVTVIGIVKGNLLVVDEKENGYRIPITEEYKKYKVGDTL